MIRYVPKSLLFGIATESQDARRRHAVRLLMSGYNAESAALLSGLSLDQVRELARTGELEIRATR